jgi:hypothetical protein
MAVLAIGHPLHRKQKSSRKGLDVFILKTFSQEDPDVFQK